MGRAAGLISGDVAILALYGSGVDTAGINTGLIALLLNFAVTFAVSAVTKDDSSHAPIATSDRPTTRRAAGGAT